MEIVGVQPAVGAARRAAKRALRASLCVRDLQSRIAVGTFLWGRGPWLSLASASGRNLHISCASMVSTIQ